MRHGGDVLDHRDFHAGGGDTADGGLASGAGSLDAHFDFLHAEELGLFGGIAGDDLSGVRGALAGALESVLAAGGPAQHITVQIGESDFGKMSIGDFLTITLI